ncbi:hypothetical protein Tco_0917524 [Tanacetum coccineum]
MIGGSCLCFVVEMCQKEDVQDPFIPLLKMKAVIREKFLINVSLRQCKRAKQRALYDFEGGLIEHYGRLWEYRQAILETNPGSTCILLIATRRDANNQMYPIAWAVVKVENNKNWCWFLSLLQEDLELGHGTGITGLLDVLQRLFWLAAGTIVESIFYNNMDQIKAILPDAYDYLVQRNPNSWSRAFFDLNSKCTSFENGIAESFNRAILVQRTKPIITMLEDIRLYIMQRLVQMKTIAMNLEDRITPSIRKRLKVLDSGSQLFSGARGIPCVHSVAAYLFLNKEPDEGVDHYEEAGRKTKPNYPSYASNRSGGKGYRGGRGDANGGRGEVSGGRGEASGGIGEASGGIGEASGGRGQASGGKARGRGGRSGRARGRGGRGQGRGGRGGGRGGTKMLVDEQYGYCKNLKKTVKTGQTRTRDGIECTKAGDLIARRVKSQLQSTLGQPKIVMSIFGVVVGDRTRVTRVTGGNANDQDSLNSAAGGNFLDKMPHECLRIIESKSKVRNSRNKAVVAKVSSSSSTPGISPDVTALTTEVSKLKNMMKTMLIDKQKAQAPVPVKAVEQSCVTCGGAHSYRNCPTTDGNVYRDNIQEYVSQAAAANFNQGNTNSRPPMVANQIRPPGFPPIQNNQNRFNQNQGNNFNQNRGTNFNQNRGNNFYQGQVYQPPTSQPPVYQAHPYQAPAPQMQGVSKTDFENYVKANDAILRNMQNQGQGLQNQMTNLTEMLSKFVNSNTASSSSSGSLPSNTVTNPKEDLKGITTRSGVAYQGPTIPTSSPKVVERRTEVTKDTVFPTNNGITEDVQPPVVLVENQNPVSESSGSLSSNTITNPKEDLKGITTRSGVAYQGPMIPTSSPEVVESRTEVTKDTVFPTNNGITEDVQPPVVPVENQIPVSEPVVAPVSAPMPNPKPSIPYPSRRNDEKRRENANEQIEKFYEIFKDMSFEISFMDALTLMPKFASTLKALIRNKEKLSEMARTPLNEHCSAVILNKLPEKLGDPGRFLIPYVIASGNLTPGYDPIVSISSPTLTPFGDSDFLLLEEADAFLALANDPTSPEVDESYYDPEGDILILEALLNSDPSPPPNQGNYLSEIRQELKLCEAKTAKTSIDEPPEVELKDLPPHLEYAFLEDNNKLPFIIAKDLSVDEKTALIKVLKSRKQTIAWKLSDIKGINPEFYSHKILMEEDYEQAVQHQRRVNPKIHDVIKKEVEKLLDAGLIYPISDSPWVSPMHCVPKKGGMTVVTNDENKLVPTRLVTGWRVCIDYRKLNESTRKDHFPFPFMDQMLERLTGNEYYCFLDGFSGYFQIPIDLKDQEKTTFTCPYRTFAYRRMPFGLCNAPCTF